MTEHPNERLVRRAYEAFESADVAVLREVLAQDVVWRSAGRNWLVGQYRGLPAVLGFFGTIAAYSEGTYRTDLHEVYAKETSAVALHRSSAHRSDGKAMSVEAVVVFEIADGKITSVRAWPWDLYHEDDFYCATPPTGINAPPGRLPTDTAAR